MSKKLDSKRNLLSTVQLSLYFFLCHLATHTNAYSQQISRNDLL